MLIQFGSFELEVSTTSVFLGINISKKWRYQTFLSRTAPWFNTSDWIDRDAKAPFDGQAGCTV